MNDTILRFLEQCHDERNKAVAWIKEHPDANVMIRASAIKNIFYDGRPHGGSTDSNTIIHFNAKGIAVFEGDNSYTFTYSSVARELVEYVKNLSTDDNDNTTIPLESLDLSVRAFNALKREGVNTANDIAANLSELSNTCKNAIDEAIPKLIENGILSETFEDNSMVLDTYESSNESTVKTSTFDYSAADITGDVLDKLHECERIIKQETAGYFTIVGLRLKEAQDLLASYTDGTFEKWYTAMGFKRQTVYNLINRVEFLSSPTVGDRADVFEQLPVTLSYEISKPDAPKELVEKVLEGDITTNAEYKRLKDELDEAIGARDAERRVNKHLRGKLDMLEVLENDNRRMSATIRELENKPIDVAIQSDTEALEDKDREIAKLKQQLEDMSEKDFENDTIMIKCFSGRDIMNLAMAWSNYAHAYDEEYHKYIDGLLKKILEEYRQ